MATVLVIDDDPAIRRVVCLQLRLAGLETVEAGEATEAFARLKEKRPDVILLDVMMPPIDGIEVCRRIRADPATMSLPVIMLTAYGTEANRERAVRAGASAMVAKPFDGTELVAIVNRFLPQLI